MTPGQFQSSCISLYMRVYCGRVRFHLRKDRRYGARDRTRRGSFVAQVIEISTSSKQTLRHTTTATTSTFHRKSQMHIFFPESCALRAATSLPVCRSWHSRLPWSVACVRRCWRVCWRPTRVNSSAFPFPFPFLSGRSHRVRSDGIESRTKVCVEGPGLMRLIVRSLGRTSFCLGRTRRRTQRRNY